MRLPSFCLLVVSLVCDAVAQPLPAEALLKSARPLVIGHRGYPVQAPENSIASFQRALDAGVDLVELDYHHSSEGIPVVIHDGTLDRTTDAIARWGGTNLAIGARTVGELVSLQNGLWYQPPFPAERLPTLEAALESIQARGITLIERKGGDAATLEKLLRKRALGNRVVVQSFDWKFLRDYRALDPHQVLGALGPPSSRDGRKLSDDEKTLSPAWLEELRRFGCQVAVWNRLVNRAAIEEAHVHGQKVWVYTIDDAAEAERLLALGVDGIITNNPALIWRTLALARSAPAPVRP